jgi:hypothetical protein
LNPNEPNYFTFLGTLRDFDTFDYSKLNFLFQVDHVRTQFPMMGGRSPPMFGTSSPHQGHHHSHTHLSGGMSPIQVTIFFIVHQLSNHLNLTEKDIG